MRGAKLLAAVLCPLALLVARSWALRLHPGQETLVKQLSSYEIITPVRVNEFGEVFPHARHFSRRKRSSEPAALRTHYRLSAYGQLFQLNLSADAGFISAQFAAVHVGAPRQPPSPDLRHCFYRGHVNAQQAHVAVLSVCGGLMGTFKAHDGEYFLEPLMKTDGGEHEDEHNKPHLIYRHEEINRKYQKSHKPCEVSEKEVKKSTLLHPNVSSLNEERNILWKSPNLEYAFKNLTMEDAGNNPHSRKKRFLSYPRYVEVMVTADTKMVRHHGQNLQHYVLTLMSIVAAIYKDSSIGNLINIVIVKLIVIHNEQEGPTITFNAATTLRNFCIWQQAQNILDDAHPSHHDTAVLITREDICRAREKCDTLGLAELGTMCDPLRSCSISEENGLSAAFTIAHELGHVFNVPHDDSFKCKEAGIKHQYHVMAPTLNYHTSPWTWSKCSQKYITEFLDTGYGECLLDKPSGRIYGLSSQLPGLMYDVNKQCELMFGLGSQVCPYLKQCKRLWCTSTVGVHKGCRTQHMPLADGTVCGVGMHCRHGICVSREMETRPVDGEWGPWGPYSSCSRTCGGGIKSTTRLCNRPEPRNGGKYCVGRRMKFRSCNTDSCPKGKKDFREQQCSEFDGKHFNINGLTSAVRWLPKYSGISMKDRCKLFCRVSGTTSYYQLKDRVADGTPCGAETNDLCVQGLCRQAGCDHVLNSKARRDKCGICGGDNSSCKTLAGTFNRARYGYNVVVQIPKGATNIDIRQHSYSGKPEDDNYLALSDVHGNFILNGNFVVSMSKREINIHGAIFEYNGSNNTVERINSTDRIEEELTLQVLCVGNLYNPDVRYSFNIPIEDRSDLFTWDPYGPWQDCSRMCQGIRRRRMTCIRRSDHVVVSDQRCEHIPPVPDVSEECNTECELRWHSIGKSDCTSKCGPGYRSIEIHCMKYSVSKGLSALVDDRYCADQQKPPTREPCHGDCTLTSWHYTEWSECSRSCERGVRTREAFCLNNLGRHLPDRECQELPRVVTQSCNEFLCPSWSASEWSECPVTCGKGMKHRQVWCQLNDEQLRDDFCNLNDRPGSVTPCELPECASWQVGPWGACTVTCGRGYQMRAVKCVTGTYRVILDDDRECNAATRPRDNQECELPSCPETTKLWTTSFPLIHVGKVTQWRYGSWTPVCNCSASCGKGDRARYVSCRDAHGGIADESFCAHLPRPAEVSSCFSPCGEWQVGNWSPCSVSCGKGLKHRDVHCFNSFQAKIEDENCRHLKRPRTYKICRAGRCPAWKASGWKECSVSCGVGIQQRDIYCQVKGLGKVSEAMCNHDARPADHRPCWLPACTRYHWLADGWENCSTSYRRKEIHQKVKCVDENQIQVDESFCNPATKPPSIKNCRRAPSKYVVLTGELSQCSASCGLDYQQRITYCVGIHSVQNKHAYGLRNVAYRECPVTPSPYIYYCNIKGCSQAATWRVGKWTKCSVSCGAGVKERTVECMTENGLSSDLCLPHLKPDTRRICHAEECEIITTCKDIQIRKGMRKDGEYLLNIKGRMIKIYCSDMHLDNPKEYLTLVKGEADNFSEVYGLRLQNPYECPFNGSRRQDCACRNDYLAAGFTVFSKIRFDVASMQIKTTDFLFAQTILGRAVPFATAGDCYSAARCPQGQFSINLAGTGLRLSSTVRWMAQGNYATADIHKSHDGTKIYGRCGGFCGKCIPNTITGLQLQIK
ncbi:A disintegrin and metalloproteinase with thrombospondin motifs 20 isoform X5 [Lagopus muta]|uniref:A disintegrin and metalloproteinase with thrombospondin motifs 20 isoform X5 n=1 Tax=Lagopus muta TaxID=64668 RepID=UPI00209CBAF7|nr:A disintegrin and metalloproteinase with thrombospondin motifs 20 isoform X5 [Lagopus muta]